MAAYGASMGIYGETAVNACGPCGGALIIAALLPGSRMRRLWSRLSQSDLGCGFNLACHTVTATGMMAAFYVCNYVAGCPLSTRRLWWRSDATRRATARSAYRAVCMAVESPLQGILSIDVRFVGPVHRQSFTAEKNDLFRRIHTGDTLSLDITEAGCWDFR